AGAKLLDETAERLVAIGALRQTNVERLEQRGRAAFDERGRNVERVARDQLIEHGLPDRIVRALDGLPLEVGADARAEVGERFDARMIAREVVVERGELLREEVFDLDVEGGRLPGESGVAVVRGIRHVEREARAGVLPDELPLERERERPGAG